MSMSRGGSRRGGDNGHPQAGPDGWIIGSNAPRRQSKVGDLSNFGKISKGQPMTFGPSSVFAGKKTETKKESISRTASNMFSSRTAENGDAAPKRMFCSIHFEDMVVDCYFCQLLNFSVNESSSNLAPNLSKQPNLLKQHLQPQSPTIPWSSLPLQLLSCPKFPP